MNDKYTSAEYQENVRQFVSREVGHCVSTLVSELAPKWEQFPDYQDELLEAYSSDPDYCECLFQAGYYLSEPDSDGYYAIVSEGGEVVIDSTDALDDACQQLNLDADDFCPEIFEHWIVSDWLADKLENHGERVLRDFFGLTVWGRTTTGQDILLDRVICDIYDALHK